MTAHLQDIRLEGKFTKPSEPVLVNGHQALVRALLLQREPDCRAQLWTAGYVSGCRVSPLAGLDQMLWERRQRLTVADLAFEPGINETSLPRPCGARSNWP